METSLFRISIIMTALLLLAGCAPTVTAPDQTTNDQNPIISNQPTTETAVEPTTIAYTNETHNFGLEFPETWSAYTATERELDWGNFGTSQSVDFGLPGQDSLFNVSIHTPEQWANLEAEQGPMPTYLGKNDNYVFGYSLAQDFDISLTSRVEEISNIIASFE